MLPIPDSDTIPASGLSAGPEATEVPVPWALTRLGRRVMRPGGMEMTRRMIDALDIGPEDRVVELAPGLGAASRIALENQPMTFTGIERDEVTAKLVRQVIRGARRCCVHGAIAQTGLDASSTSVAYGESILSFQNEGRQRAILAEAFRFLQSGGRLGLHEIALTPEYLEQSRKDRIASDLLQNVDAEARLLTCGEWLEMLRSVGLEVEIIETAPLQSLTPLRLMRNEGLRDALRVFTSVLRSPAARKRFAALRDTLSQHRDVVSSVFIVAQKPWFSGPL
ncbi:MAG: SAM-dependent methyltransferase [Acidobacteriota bacterium]